MGIKSIGADPSRVYLACGTYTNARTPTGLIFAPRTATRACLAESMWAPTDGCFVRRSDGALRHGSKTHWSRRP
jgi:hypothetical protein